MDYVPLGCSGIRVSQLSMGTMTFGKEADERTARAIMDRAFDVGINLFDTADMYCEGRTEEIVGRWIAPHRKDIILASKVHFPMGPGPNERGSSRRNIMFAVEACLRRLQTDWLDILYLHHWDEDTLIDESLAAVTDLIRQGKVLYCAVSNFAAWQTMKAIGVASARGFAPIIAIQPMYNLVKRQAEVELLPLALAEGLAVCTYSPLAAGLLTGKYQRGDSGRLNENEMYRLRHENKEYWDASERFVEFAHEHGYAPAALAVTWVQSHPAVTSPIVGARSLEQLNGSLESLDIKLTAEEREAISALSAAPPIATDR